jgi:threonine aldolase
VDSVQFCLSKGLSAPVGSMVVGSRAFIDEARRVRKLLGGGMRQAGIIAAAGVVALNEMVERLAEDHVNAKKLAEGLAEIPNITVAPETVETNILFFGVRGEDGAAGDVTPLVTAAAQAGVLLSGGDDGRIRAVTHYGIDAADIERALAVLAEAMQGLPAPVGA